MRHRHKQSPEKSVSKCSLLWCDFSLRHSSTSVFVCWIYLPQNSSCSFMDFSSSAGQGYMCTTPAQQSSAADPSVNPAPLPRISPLSSSPRLGQPLPTTPQGPSARQAAVLLPLYFPLSWWSWGWRGGGNKRADVAFLPSLPPPHPPSTPTAPNQHTFPFASSSSSRYMYHCPR